MIGTYNMNNYLINAFKDKIRPPFYQVWLGWWIGSFLIIICHIINILTLCFWRPYWDVTFVMWTQGKIRQVKLEYAAAQLMKESQRAAQTIVDSEKKIINDIDAGNIDNSIDRDLFS